jgi:hypothetical protein
MEEQYRLRWENVALISVYSPPDAELLKFSHGTLWSCTHEGNDGLQIINVKTIKAVVAMIPHRPTLPSGITKDRFFMVEKAGLDVTLTGIEVKENQLEDL